MSAPATATKRPVTAASLDLITSAAAAELFVAEIEDLADAVQKDADENGKSRISAARIRGLRRHARQLRELHELVADTGTNGQ